VLGREVPVGMFPWATDARFLSGRLGIPTIAALGPGCLPLAHSQQEHLAVEELLQAAQIYALTALDYLSS
jgi:acetylornithine deacetylase/succinyl-diaminopimelate desuccinylase-like protein